MIFEPRTSALQRDWRTEIDTSLEAGQTPLLDLGSSQQMLRGLPVLIALRTFVARRVDVATPNLLIGGNPILWLVCLMQVRSPAEARRSPEPTVVFAGPDVVTYLASLTTLTPERTSEAASISQAIPPNMRPLFLPNGAAQVVAPWALLPFAVLEATQTSSSSAPSPSAESADEWLGWIALGLVALLILAALVV